ncbi:mannonate dehydratase [Olivibacter sitiensis]|uniref:mannonate dehydratase n=1 Tax=Olivibacter sitiensis TaxID=376470 RepID=UPI000483B829|nr:mannonate dehydratase [Olivibacter sitiensis]
MKLLQSWRWYGPNDPVTLQDVKQAGASNIVTALHYIPHGEVWPIADIEERKRLIEAEGLSWTVVESVPVHEAIKTRAPEAEHYLENYRKTLGNLAACGITTVCYNFMPVLDWTRTQLDMEMTDGSKALYFDWVDLAVFDIFLLKREGAEADYATEVLQQAEARYAQMTESDLDALSQVVLMGIPTEADITLEHLSRSIEIYKAIGFDGLRDNLAFFLSSIADVCTASGIKMTIHPDDPPYPILGLPRIASTKADFLAILKGVDQAFNGVCFCTGSLGAGKDNDVVEILKAVKDRIYFAHLRNVKKDAMGNFYEADHLGGDVNMYEVMKVLCEENAKRAEPIPFRPDHGHQMLDDLHKQSNPGYSAIGRLRGLAELRGLELGVTGDY